MGSRLCYGYSLFYDAAVKLIPNDYQTPLNNGTFLPKADDHCQYYTGQCKLLYSNMGRRRSIDHQYNNKPNQGKDLRYIIELAFVRATITFTYSTCVLWMCPDSILRSLCVCRTHSVGTLASASISRMDGLSSSMLVASSSLSILRARIMMMSLSWCQRSTPPVALAPLFFYIRSRLKQYKTC